MNEKPKREFTGWLRWLVYVSGLFIAWIGSMVVMFWIFGAGG